MKPQEVQKKSLLRNRLCHNWWKGRIPYRHSGLDPESRIFSECYIPGCRIGVRHDERKGTNFIIMTQPRKQESSPAQAGWNYWMPDRACPVPDTGSGMTKKFPIFYGIPPIMTFLHRKRGRDFIAYGGETLFFGNRRLKGLIFKGPRESKNKASVQR